MVDLVGGSAVARLRAPSSFSSSCSSACAYSAAATGPPCWTTSPEVANGRQRMLAALPTAVPGNSSYRLRLSTSSPTAAAPAPASSRHAAAGSRARRRATRARTSAWACRAGRCRTVAAPLRSSSSPPRMVPLCVDIGCPYWPAADAIALIMQEARFASTPRSPSQEPAIRCASSSRDQRSRGAHLSAAACQPASAIQRPPHSAT